MKTNKIRIITHLLIFMLALTLSGCSYKTADIDVSTKETASSSNITQETTEKKVAKPTPTATPQEESTEEPFNEEKLLSSCEKLYYTIHYFDNGITISNSNFSKTPSASVIKIFIMQYVYEEIAAGNITEDDVVSGSNIINLVKTMIQNSDNNATNLLIEHFGMDEINTFIKNAGYKNTELQRKMLDFNAQANGKENYTSTDDVMLFLKMLYERQNEYPYSTMLDIMKGQNVRTKIPQGLPSGTTIANKTGELSTVENDVGIVFSEGGDFAIAVLTDGVISPQSARNAIADLAKQAFERINK